MNTRHHIPEEHYEWRFIREPHEYIARYRRVYLGYW